MPRCLTTYTEKKVRPWLEPLFLCGGLALILCSVALGAVSLSLGDIWGALTGQAGSAVTNIVLYVRLPRTIACMLAGSALAVSGLVLQAVLNNSLASPGIIGVNTGAGFGVVLAALAFPGVIAARSLAAFAGAFAVCLLVYGIAKRTGASRITIVLAGVAVSSLFSAAIDGIVTLYPHTLTDKTAFAIGGFSAVDHTSLLFGLPIIVLGLAGAWLLAGQINVLTLGDDVAFSLGLSVERCRFLSILIASALAAGAVSIAGLLGFIGLIVPHMVRLLAGTDHQRAVPLAALAGMDLALLCDIAVRLVFAPYEFPVGILMSLLGAPFFLWLLLEKRRRRCFD